MTNLNSKMIIKFSLLLALILAGCSNIDGISLGGGTGGSSNDARPSGNPLSQGQFFGQNSETVSGSALVFASTTTANTYILRLEGLTTPVEGGLQVQVYGNGPTNPAYTTTLKANSGNQNYTFNGIAGIKFSNVYIYSTSKQVNYGSAQLISTTTTVITN